MKKITIILGILAVAGLMAITVITKAQEMMLKNVNANIADYYYISSPNGNSLEITQEGLLCQYDIKSYAFSTTENNGHFTYKLQTDILGDTRFYATGIAGDKNANYETEFPKCVAEKNDALSEQLLFHPSAGGEIESADRGHGKLYISLKKAHSLSETAALVESLKEYGEVTWLWVDTYAGTDISGTSMVQNPYSAEKNSALPQKYVGVYGMPLYYDGEPAEGSVQRFINILNNCKDIADDFCQQQILTVKRNIKPDGGAITEGDIKIIGLVLLLPENSDRDDTFSALLKNEEIRVVR